MEPTSFADQRRSFRKHVAIPIRYTIASEDYRVEHVWVPEILSRSILPGKGSSNLR